MLEGFLRVLMRLMGNGNTFSKHLFCDTETDQLFPLREEEEENMVVATGMCD